MRRVTRTIAAAGAAIACCVTMTACSSPFGLPISGSVQTLAPVEQQTQRVYTNPQGPADDAQPETIVKGFYDAMPAGVQSDGYRVGPRVPDRLGVGRVEWRFLRHWSTAARLISAAAPTR